MWTETTGRSCRSARPPAHGTSSRGVSPPRPASHAHHHPPRGCYSLAVHWAWANWRTALPPALQWACHNVSCDCTFEQFGTLDGTGLNLTSTLHTDRQDTTAYPANSQELPAVYSNGPWYRLLSYNGSQPWQKEPVVEYLTGFRGPGAKGGAWIPGSLGVSRCVRPLTRFPCTAWC